MKNPTTKEIEGWRTHGPVGEPYGQFVVKRGAFRFLVQASAGSGWDHVSVSCHSRCPTWEEMDHIKRLFFHDHEVAMQLHIGGDAKVNLHPFCLHIWRPQTKEEIDRERASWMKHGEPEGQWDYPPPIPLPPKHCV